MSPRVWLSLTHTHGLCPDVLMSGLLGVFAVVSVRQAGCVLVRDGEAQLRTFSDRPDYLAPSTRGIAANSPWPVDYGLELSRGFRALKV